MPVEIHVIRLGDMAIATNRFELYLDFGIRIKARSKAVQTFVVQLAGPSFWRAAVSNVPSPPPAKRNGGGEM